MYGKSIERHLTIILMATLLMSIVSCHGGSPLIYGKRGASTKPPSGRSRIAVSPPRTVDTTTSGQTERNSNYFSTANYTETSSLPVLAPETSRRQTEVVSSTLSGKYTRQSDRATYETEIAKEGIEQLLQALADFLPTPWLRVTASMAIRLGVEWSVPFIAWCIETFDWRPSESDLVRLLAGER